MVHAFGCFKLQFVGCESKMSVVYVTNVNGIL